MSKITVRPAESADLVAVAAIYAEAVHTGVATFDIEEPPHAYWQAKVDSTGVGDHFLVARDENTVLGFAYSGVFRSRPAYGRTREASIYLAPAASGSGLGTRLFSALVDLLRKDQVHLVVSVVAQPNPASNALHLKLGFTEVGTLDEVGFKFGRYVSTTWFQLRLT